MMTALEYGRPDVFVELIRSPARQRTQQALADRVEFEHCVFRALSSLCERARDESAVLAYVEPVLDAFGISPSRSCCETRTETVDALHNETPVAVLRAETGSQLFLDGMLCKAASCRMSRTVRFLLNRGADPGAHDRVAFAGACDVWGKFARASKTIDRRIIEGAEIVDMMFRRLHDDIRRENRNADETFGRHECASICLAAKEAGQCQAANEIDDGTNLAIVLVFLRKADELARDDPQKRYPLPIPVLDGIIQDLILSGRCSFAGWEALTRCSSTLCWRLFGGDRFEDEVGGSNTDDDNPILHRHFLLAVESFAHLDTKPGSGFMRDRDLDLKRWRWETVDYMVRRGGARFTSHGCLPLKTFFARTRNRLGPKLDAFEGLLVRTALYPLLSDRSCITAIHASYLPRLDADSKADLIETILHADSAFVSVSSSEEESVRAFERVVSLMMPSSPASHEPSKGGNDDVIYRGIKQYFKRYACVDSRRLMTDDVNRFALAAIRRISATNSEMVATWKIAAQIELQEESFSLAWKGSVDESSTDEQRATMDAACSLQQLVDQLLHGFGRTSADNGGYKPFKEVCMYSVTNLIDRARSRDHGDDDGSKYIRAASLILRAIRRVGLDISRDIARTTMIRFMEDYNVATAVICSSALKSQFHRLLRGMKDNAKAASVSVSETCASASAFTPPKLADAPLLKLEDVAEAMTCAFHLVRGFDRHYDSELVRNGAPKEEVMLTVPPHIRGWYSSYISWTGERNGIGPNPSSYMVGDASFRPRVTQRLDKALSEILSVALDKDGVFETARDVRDVNALLVAACTYDFAYTAEVLVKRLGADPNSRVLISPPYPWTLRRTLSLPPCSKALRGIMSRYQHDVLWSVRRRGAEDAAEKREPDGALAQEEERSAKKKEYEEGPHLLLWLAMITTRSRKGKLRNCVTLRTFETLVHRLGARIEGEEEARAFLQCARASNNAVSLKSSDIIPKATTTLFQSTVDCGNPSSPISKNSCVVS